MKMKKRILFLLINLLVSAFIFSGDLVVVVNKENSIDELTPRELVDIYLGKDRTFDNGLIIVAYDQRNGSKERAVFYRFLVNKSVAQMNAYWARLLFTGRATPPSSVVDSQAVLKFVQYNEGAIGYIDSEYLDGTVKEVFRVQ